MKPALKIAWRYFKGKKSAQAINIISWISIGAIAVSSGAMVVLFSVFNGLEGTVKDMYAAFYPDIKVSAAKGKFFRITPEQKNVLEKTGGIDIISYSLEDMVLLNGNDEQKVATLKGVDNNWFKVSRLDSFMLDNRPAGWTGDEQYTPAILGLGVSSSLGIDVNNVFSGLKIYYPRQGVATPEYAEAALNSITVKPEGLFRMQDEFDGKYVLTTLGAAQYLFNSGNSISSIELKLKHPSDEKQVRASVEQLIGSNIKTENRFEQNKTLFMIMRGEKWAVYAILLLVLLIASFNMIGSLSMLVLEKKKDIAILRSMGADKSMIRNIFLLEGGLLALLGAGIGIVTGLLLCLGQQYFGWISLPQGFIIEAYPVILQFNDILLVVLTALPVGFLAAWYPAVKASRQPVYVREE
jgi:lipoprotein-releasing system permease protein